MKIELSIDSKYFPEWGVYEGIRELLSNMKDAESQLAAPATCTYRKETQTLVLTNEGTTLPHEALLLGATTKRDRSDLIGRFGEGLKGGVLALVRAGNKVKILSGSEVWTPSIQRSEKFSADVLVFEIEKGWQERERVQVEVSGISQEDWDAMANCFLFLMKQSKLDKIKISTSNGGLLVDPAFFGRVYVKGVFVGTDPKLHFGYDFWNASLDRDRKMVEKYDLQYRCQAIWQEALNKRPDLIQSFLGLLERNASDVDGLSDWSAQNLSEATKKEALKVFRDRHGNDAVPVETLADSKDIEHLGKKGVVVSKPLRYVIETLTGNVNAVKENLRHEVVRNYSWGELEDSEKANLESAIALISAVEPVDLSMIDIVDCRDAKILGLYKDCRVLLTKKMLATHKDCLEVLVHEVSHFAGGDGDKGHVATIERLWSGIVANLLAQKN